MGTALHYATLLSVAVIMVGVGVATSAFGVHRQLHKRRWWVLFMVVVVGSNVGAAVLDAVLLCHALRLI